VRLFPAFVDASMIPLSVPCYLWRQCAPKIHNILNARNKIRVLNYLIRGRGVGIMKVLQNGSTVLSDKTKNFPE
jgi:hypothetical protein